MNNNQNSNPLLCDIETGTCEIPVNEQVIKAGSQPASEKPVKIIYFTDPICSSCWGIEPQLRKLKLEYGHHIDVEYRMGGLLPDWSYNSGGISKPSDVAHHWDEVSRHYNMPIDGDVWLEDPLHSSYPPSIAFKAAQLQDKTKAIDFLRATREMVFLEKKNITKWEHLAEAAIRAGLDADTLKHDYENDAILLFQQDLELARQMGVRGFPSLFINDISGKQEFVYGVKPYEVFEKSVIKIYPGADKLNYNKTPDALFDKYPTLTTREFAELSGVTIAESEVILQRLLDENKLHKMLTKNGPLWLWAK